MLHLQNADAAQASRRAHPGIDRLVQRFADGVAERSDTAFDIVLPDGQRCHAGAASAAFTIEFHDESALLALLTRGHIGLLESYFDGRLDVQGDLGRALASGLAAGLDVRPQPLNSLENGLHEWRHSNRSPAQANANERAH